MSKKTSIDTQRFSLTKLLPRLSQTPHWHAFGLGRQDRPDPAAIAFARLGLLAYRW